MVVAVAVAQRRRLVDETHVAVAGGVAVGGQLLVQMLMPGAGYAAVAASVGRDVRKLSVNLKEIQTHVRNNKNTLLQQ